MYESCILDVFGVRVNYHPSWRIIPDTAYSLNFDSGLFRFEENVLEKRSSISFGVRWECSQTTLESFLEEFRENIQQEYRKTIKGKNQNFELLRDEIVENTQGKKMCYIETQYRATQGLSNARKTMQRLRVCNMATYCEDTHRMVICSIVTTPQYMEENREMLEGYLHSLETHPVYTPEAEADRMAKRAEQRERAIVSRKGPLEMLKYKRKMKNQANENADSSESTGTSD